MKGLPAAAQRELQTVLGAALASALLMYAPLLLGGAGTLLSLFALTPLFVVALRHGLTALCACGVLLWGLQAAILYARYAEGWYFFNHDALLTLILYGLPAAVTAVSRRHEILRRQWPALLALLACVITVMTWWVLQQPKYQQLTETQVSLFFEEYRARYPEKLDTEALERQKSAAAVIMRYFPAIAGLGCYLGFLLNLAMAQRLLRSTMPPLFRLRDVTTPWWLMSVLLVTCLATLAPPVAGLAQNLAFVLLCPLAIAGLGILQQMLTARQPQQLLLLAFYLMLLHPYSWLVLAFVGGADRFFNMRRLGVNPKSKD